MKARAPVLGSMLVLLVLFAGCQMPSSGFGSAGSGSTPTAPASAGPPFTVTYVRDYAPSGSPPVDVNSYADGAMVTVLGAGSLTWPSWTFRGWGTTAQQGLNPTYTVGAQFAIHANVTLHDAWTFP